MLSKQQAFEKAITGILTQGRISFSEPSCKYRGEDGDKCAIGWLIPDEIYDKKMEECGTLTRTYPILKKTLNIVDDLKFYQKLQKLHDNFYAKNLKHNYNFSFRKLFAESAKKLANDFKLKTEFIDDLLETLNKQDPSDIRTPDFLIKLKE